jgi:DNA-directed RNA polymerase subunit RPC12/RpoP
MQSANSLSPKCQKCGQLVAWDIQATGDTIVSCEACGHQLGTTKQIKEAGVAYLSGLKDDFTTRIFRRQKKPR